MGRPETEPVGVMAHTSIVQAEAYELVNTTRRSPANRACTKESSRRCRDRSEPRIVPSRADRIANPWSEVLATRKSLLASWMPDRRSCLTVHAGPLWSEGHSE